MAVSPASISGSGKGGLMTALVPVRVHVVWLKGGEMLFQANSQHRVCHMLRQFLALCTADWGLSILSVSPCPGGSLGEPQQWATVVEVEDLTASFSLGSGTTVVSYSAENCFHSQHPKTTDNSDSRSVLYLSGQHCILNSLPNPSLMSISVFYQIDGIF